MRGNFQRIVAISFAALGAAALLQPGMASASGDARGSGHTDCTGRGVVAVQANMGGGGGRLLVSAQGDAGSTQHSMIAAHGLNTLQTWHERATWTLVYDGEPVGNQATGICI